MGEDGYKTISHNCVNGGNHFYQWMGKAKGFYCLRCCKYQNDIQQVVPVRQTTSDRQVTDTAKSGEKDE